MEERRNTPRASCRLHGRVRQKRGHIRVRIIDISEGGLCLYSPVEFEAKTKIEIDVRGFPECIVQAEVWHVRSEKGRRASRKVWAVGAMLDKSDEGYLRLLAAAGVAPEGISTEAIDRAGAEAVRAHGRGNQSTVSPQQEPEDLSPEAGLEPRIFRIRVQAQTGPRTRLLTFTADSRADAEAMAIAALQPEWRVIEVLVF